MLQDVRETRVIAFCNMLLGIAVMLGGLAYYMHFTPTNVGGVFYLLFSSLSVILLLGIGILSVWNRDRFGRKIETFIASIANPIIAVGLIFGSGAIGIFLVRIVATRYPFFGIAPFKNGGILALYGLAVLLGSSFLSPFYGKLKTHFLNLREYRYYVDRHWVMVLLLFVVIFFTFRNSYSGALLRLDDLIMIDFARNESLFAAIISPPEVYSNFYRPMHNLVLWVYYELFGLDYASYQFAELLGHFFTVVLFYWLMFIISREKVFALIGAVLFGTHIYISVGVVYVNSVFWWLGVFGVLVQIVVAKSPKMRWYSLLGLGVFLLFNLLIGEYGFALVGAICLMASYLMIFHKQDRTYAIALFLLGISVTVIYFGMRWQAVGLFPESGGGSSGYFWEFYQNPRVLGINHYIYTVVANFISSFVPIFSQVGVLILPSLVQIIFGISIFSLYLFGIRKVKENSVNGFLWLPVLYIYMIGSKEIVKYLIGNYNLSLTFSLHTILNVAIAFLILNWKKISKEHQRISVFALGMLVSGCVVAFAYFRWRTHYYTHMAWIILVIIGMSYIKNVRAGKAIVTSMVMVSLLMSWKSMKIIDSRLPAIKIEQFQHNLCDPRVSKDLALDVIEYYGIEDEGVITCVADKP